MFKRLIPGLRLLRHTPRALRAACSGLPALALALLPAALAQADTSRVSATAGYEYYTGPDHQLTRTTTGEVEASILGATASVLGGRIDDQGAGVGLKLGAGLGLPVAPRTQFKLDAERAEGDSSYAAWKLEAGPAFELVRGQTLSLQYVRAEDNASTITNGARANLEGPVVPDHLNASGEVAYTQLRGLGGIEGTAGLSWTPVEHMEIEGEAGYTQTGINLDHPFSSRQVIGASRQRLQGHKVTTALESAPGMIAQVAVRFSFP